MLLFPDVFLSFVFFDCSTVVIVSFTSLSVLTNSLPSSLTLSNVPAPVLPVPVSPLFPLFPPVPELFPVFPVLPPVLVPFPEFPFPVSVPKSLIPSSVEGIFGLAFSISIASTDISFLVIFPVLSLTTTVMIPGVAIAFVLLAS